jgi:hypothetical protein
MFLAVISSLATVAASPPAPTLWISHTAARVRVIPEARADVVATVTRGSADAPMPSVRRTAGGAVVDAGLPALDWKPGWLGGMAWGGGGGRARVGRRGWWGGRACGGGGVQLKGKSLKPQDLPLVTVHTPLNVIVIAEGALYGEVGPSANLSLFASGCGAWRAAAVQRDLSITTKDAVSVRAASLYGRLNIDKSGASEVTVDGGNAPRASIRASGSGNVAYHGDSGQMDLFMRDKANVRLGKVFGRTSGDLRTQGDLTYDRR